MLQAVVSPPWIFPTAVLHAQSPPSDFKFSATVGGSGPWSEMARITIDNAGQGKYARLKTGGAPAVLAETTFTVSAPDLQQLWKMIQDSSFFSLAPSWTDTSVHDGMFARMVVTANGTTHDVRIKNVAQPTIQGMLDLLNALVPDTLRLQYSPPEKFAFHPKGSVLLFVRRAWEQAKYRIPAFEFTRSENEGTPPSTPGDDQSCPARRVVARRRHRGL